MKDTLRMLRSVLTPRFGRGETEAIIRLLFHHLKGWSPVDMIVNDNATLSPFVKRQAEEIVRRLLNDEPIQYITGEARFYGMEMKVDGNVLIPRPETEDLVELIVKENPQPDLRVLDMGTGSGCIAIALARNLRFPQIEALDVSEGALKVARENARRLKADIRFIHADVFSYIPSPDSLDIIVSNPPYVDESEKSGMERNVLDHEPHNALFVPDDDPLKYYRRIAEIGRDALSDAGKIYFEINPRHANEMKALMSETGYSDITLTKDIHGRERFLSCHINKTGR